MRRRSRLASQRLRRTLVGVPSLLVSICLFASSARSVQPVDLHDQAWYVHVDLVTASEPLAYWQGVIEAALVQANQLLEGGQGPFDTPCCTRLAAVDVTTFGTPNDGFDVIDSSAEQEALNTLGGLGSAAFLVDSITWCGGSAPNSIGCGELPGCSGNPNDDPNLWMAVTVDSFEAGTLPSVIAHERGHNSCLVHVAQSVCQLMQGVVATPSNGGCLTSTECTHYRSGRTTTSSGLECGCHATAGVLESDGSACTELDFGICSGGLCGEPGGDAAARLVASAHPGSAGIPAPDDALAISTLAGAWRTLGQITPTADDVQGLAYARDSGTLYGVIPTSGNDSIVTIDPDSGAVLATVGLIGNGSAELISMAYHPGATSSPEDDRLVMLEVSGSEGRVVWVDPASPSVRNVYGLLAVGSPEEFTGLAYDSLQGKLFASTPFGPDGLYQIDLTSCPPSPCNAAQVPGARLFVEDGSLAFSPETGMLYQIGTAFGGSRTFYNIIDPTNGASALTFSLDVLTPGGLAAVPEPGLGAGLLAGAIGLGWAARRSLRGGLRRGSGPESR